MLLSLSHWAFNIGFSSNKLASSAFFCFLTFGCLTLPRQESSPLVSLEQQDALSILAAHFAKVPSARGKKSQRQSSRIWNPVPVLVLVPVQSRFSLWTSLRVVCFSTLRAGCRDTPLRHRVCVQQGRLSASTSVAPDSVRLHRLPNRTSDLRGFDVDCAGLYFHKLNEVLQVEQVHHRVQWGRLIVTNRATNGVFTSKKVFWQRDKKPSF